MQSILIQTLFRPARRRMRFRTAFVLYFLILILGSLPHAREEIGRALGALHFASELLQRA